MFLPPLDAVLTLTKSFEMALLARNRVCLPLPKAILLIARALKVLLARLALFVFELLTAKLCSAPPLMGGSRM